MGKSLKQIQAQIDRLQIRAENVRAREVLHVVGRIKLAISHYGLSASDLFAKDERQAVPPTTVKAKRRAPRESLAKGTKVPIKYQDGEGNAWSGRGSRPRWLSARLALGKRLEDFLV